jgi:predicted Fe-S protein YdhL (DUF1289 family)
MTEPGGAPLPSIASPCVRNCCLDDGDICMGCFRSLTEICSWTASSPAEKTAILQRCAERREQRRSKNLSPGG